MPLYLVVNKEKRKIPKIANFIDFILSDEGQQVISDAGTVNLKEGLKAQKAWNAKAEKNNLPML